VGVAAGAYSYLTGFAPVYRELDLSFGTEYSIIGERYGGGENAAFRLEADGSYRATVDDGPVQSGVIDESLRRTLRTTLSDVNLARISEEIDPAQCVSELGGTDVRYEIIQEDETFVLDSCTTRFARQSDLGVLLDIIWRDITES